MLATAIDERARFPNHPCVLVEDFEVPEGTEAEYLLAGLARLIGKRGADTFLAAPVLLPEPRFFPDPVEPRAKGVSVLLRRLLAYAELDASHIEIEIYGGNRVTNAAAANPHHEADAAAWFMGLAEGVYRFGVRESTLGDERGLIGTLGHEVAHAYRRHHALEAREREVEEQLTDLTSVYLGFGLFSLENSFRFVTGGYDESGQRLSYRRSATGYLLPGQLAYLLAAQLVVRGDRALYQRVSRALSANQARALETAFQALSADVAWLSNALGLPPAEQWPAPRALEDALTPLVPVQLSLHDAPVEQRARDEQERIAFRVASNRGPLGLVAGGFVGFFVALQGDLSLGFWPFTITASVLGFFAARRLGSATCSSCSHGVGRHAVRCPTCSVHLIGDIADINQRLEAEDDYRTAQLAPVPRREPRDTEAA